MYGNAALVTRIHKQWCTIKCNKHVTRIHKQWCTIKCNKHVTRIHKQWCTIKCNKHVYVPTHSLLIFI